MYSQIKEYLFNDVSKEYACYVLCGHAIINDIIRLLGCYLVIPDENDYIEQSLASVKLDQKLLINVLKECENLNLSLIDIHSHPFSTDIVNYSGTDDADEREKSKWFSEKLPNSYYGSIVMGKNSHQARIFYSNKEGFSFNNIPLSIRSLEVPLILEGKNKSFNREMYDRQLRSFTTEGQQLLSNAKIGIVGLGGIGAGLTIGLARLGVRNFKLIDFDKAEISNLNRLEGMTEVDAKLNTHKVDIVARKLLEISADISCKKIKGDITKQRTWKQLRDVDIIVTATDNQSSRIVLNMISLMYLIPQISTGTLISTKNGELDGGHGHVFTLLPGHNQPCLLCAEIINPIEVYYEIGPSQHRMQALKNGYIENFLEPSPAVTHLNGIIINLALVEIHNLLCGFKQSSKHLVYSMLDQELYPILESERNCASCVPGGGFFGQGDLAGDPLSNFISSFQ